MKINASRSLSGKSAGFTLMELMLVLGIITLLMAVVLKMGPVLNKNGNEVAARADVGNLGAAIMMYKNKHTGRLPANLEKMVGAEITDAMLSDPWGNKYIYQVGGKRNRTDGYDLYSMGHDRQDGTPDDVGNFESN